MHNLHYYFQTWKLTIFFNKGKLLGMVNSPPDPSQASAVENEPLLIALDKPSPNNSIVYRFGGSVIFLNRIQ